MMDKNLLLETLKRVGKIIAEDLQKRSSDMMGTELYEEKLFIPKFNPERQYLNFTVGYICQSEAGRVVKLLQPYDSTIFTQQPEELPAQWGFYWSTNPDEALPFVAISTSPYMKGDCCIENDIVYRSLIDNNTWKPSEYPQGWEVTTK